MLWKSLGKQQVMDQNAILSIIKLIEEKLQLGKALDTIKIELRTYRFTDDEIEEAIRQFRKSSPQFSNPEFVNKLVDNSEWESWYRGPSPNPDSHWMLLKDVLRNKKSRPWNQDMIQSLDVSSSAVMSRVSLQLEMKNLFNSDQLKTKSFCLGKTDLYWVNFFESLK